MPKKAVAKTSSRQSIYKPSMKEMVLDAITSESVARKGVSFYKIKQFIAAKYDHNDLKSIKRCVLNGIDQGEIVNVKGSGLNGSMRLNARKNSSRTRKSLSAKDSNEGEEPESPAKLKKSTSTVGKMDAEIKPKRAKNVQPKKQKAAKKASKRKISVIEEEVEPENFQAPQPAAKRAKINVKEEDEVENSQEVPSSETKASSRKITLRTRQPTQDMSEDVNPAVKVKTTEAAGQKTNEGKTSKVSFSGVRCGTRPRVAIAPMKTKSPPVVTKQEAIQSNESPADAFDDMKTAPFVGDFLGKENKIDKDRKCKESPSKSEHGEAKMLSENNSG